MSGRARMPVASLLGKDLHEEAECLEHSAAVVLQKLT